MGDLTRVTGMFVWRNDKTVRCKNLLLVVLSRHPRLQSLRQPEIFAMRLPRLPLKYTLPFICIVSCPIEKCLKFPRIKKRTRKYFFQFQYFYYNEYFETTCHVHLFSNWVKLTQCVSVLYPQSN